MASQQPLRREPERLRVVKGRPEETPIIDLQEGVRLYYDLLAEVDLLQDIADSMRGRILRAMERTGLDEFEADGVHAIRQVRHFPPRLNEERATRILEREGRLKEATTTTLDHEKARAILDELYVQHRIDKDELPYTEAREVEALIVRATEEGETE